MRKGATQIGTVCAVNGRKERVQDQTIRLAGGRTVGFADYGIPDATAVLWCHGGPGSRLEPAYLRREATEAGLRIIGIDRPGYGLSTPQPGRTIAGWVPEALAAATDAHGEGGSKMRGGGMAAALAPSDVALFGDPAWMKAATAQFPAMFAHGLEGYTDDRLADGAGWVTFDVTSIQCPVTVLHGGSDRMVDVIHARHTAELVPGSELVIFDDLGHFSIMTKVVPAIVSLLQR
jgi:pimeloyl-ACP methyl ester carboxylesterase